jgi:hypothetical protein
MKRFEIWDRWSKLGDVDAFNPDHAIREFRKVRGMAWVKMFAYPA